MWAQFVGKIPLPHQHPTRIRASVRWPKSVTAISISPQQFQFHHGSSTSFTAISTSFAVISISRRQFHFHHGNFNFVHGNFNFTVAISILSRQFFSTCLRTGKCRGEIEIAVRLLCYRTSVLFLNI